MRFVCDPTGRMCCTGMKVAAFLPTSRRLQRSGILAFVDYDRDGDLDLYAANYMEFDPATRSASLARREFTAAPIRTPGKLACSTATTGAAALPTRLARWPACSFSGNSPRYSAISTTTATPICVANESGPTFSFWWTERLAKMAEVGVAYNEEGLAESAMGADWGDYDNDGFLDIIVAPVAAQYALPQRRRWVLHGCHVCGQLRRVQRAVSRYRPPFSITTTTGSSTCSSAMDTSTRTWKNTSATTYPQRNQLFRNRGDGSFAENDRASGSELLVERVSQQCSATATTTGTIYSSAAAPHCTLLRMEVMPTTI